MEATGSDAERRRNLRGAISWVFATRAARFPLLVVTGAVATLLVATYVHANYIELCQRYSVFPSQCSPVRLATAYSTALAVTGLTTLIFGPIVNSLYHLFRYGQPWEATRVETSISNYPLLGGLIYLLAAAILVFV